MSAYPKPRFDNTSIFLYSSTPSSRTVVVPGPAPPDTSITEEEMTNIALFSNYSYIFASYPWLPSPPNVQPKSIYTLWNQLLYGEDYLAEISPGNYEWTESLEYVIDGIISPYRITGSGIDFQATSTRPRGLTANNEITLVRNYKPFVLCFSGTPTDSCITFEVDNFKMELMSDYSVVYYIDNIQVARSISLGTSRNINMLGFSQGILTGNNVMQDTTTGTYTFTRLRIASDVVFTNTSSTTLPSIVKSGSSTWKIKNGITLNQLNLYESLDPTELTYETYLVYDMCNMRCNPPNYLAL